MKTAQEENIVTALTSKKRKESLVIAQPDCVISFAVLTRRVSTTYLAPLTRVPAGERAVTRRCPASLQEIVSLVMPFYLIHLFK